MTETATADTPKKRGPKPGYKRSPESIEKAKATRARNRAAALAAAGDDPVAAPKRRGRPPGSKNTGNGAGAVKEFKLYSTEGDELGYLVTVKGKNGPDAATAAVSSGQVQPGVPVVALPLSVLNVHVVDEVQPPPLYVLRTEPKPGGKRRGRAPAKKNEDKPDVVDATPPDGGTPDPDPTPQTTDNPFA